MTKVSSEESKAAIKDIQEKLIERKSETTAGKMRINKIGGYIFKDQVDCIQLEFILNVMQGMEYYTKNIKSKSVAMSMSISVTVSLKL